MEQVRSRTVSFVVVATAVVVAACGGASGGEGAAPSTVPEVGAVPDSSREVSEQDAPADQTVTDGDPSIADLIPGVGRLEWEFELPPRADAAGAEWARTAPGSETMRVAFSHFNSTAVPGNPCAPEFVTAVTENDTEVRVAVAAVVEFTADMPADRLDWFVADDGTVVADCDAKEERRVVDVDLVEPLGDRGLVFAGQRFEVFTIQLATPQWMPDSWAPVRDEALGLERPDVDDPGWYRTWESQPETRGQFVCEPRTQTGLTLLEGPTGLIATYTDEPWEPGSIDTYDINGIPADYAIDDVTNRIRLTWTIDDRTYVVQSLEFATQCPLGDPPDLDTTLRFARELAL